MLSHTTYKVVHLLGIFLLFSGLGGVWAMAVTSVDATRTAGRRLLMATHGVALLLILLGGFGMLARLGISGAWPPWVWIKLTIWIILAASPWLLRRTEGAHSMLFYLAPLLGAIAAYSALFRIGGVQ
jgi:hypothetical protein